MKIGSAYPGEEDKNLVVKGRNLVDGLPKDITISSAEVREALADPLATIVEAIRTTLEKTPPELSADIIDHGIMLTGGGALLKGLDMLVMQRVCLFTLPKDRLTVLLTVQEKDSANRSVFSTSTIDNKNRQSKVGQIEKTPPDRICNINMRYEKIFT